MLLKVKFLATKLVAKNLTFSRIYIYIAMYAFLYIYIYIYIYTAQSLCM